jgi:hypothetical protein
MIYVSLFGINLLILYMRFLKKKSGTYFLDFPSGPEYQVTSGCGGIPAQCLWYKWFNPVSFGQILRLSLQVQLKPGKLVTIPAANLVPRCVSNYLDGGVTKALTAVFCLKSDLTFMSGLGTTRGKSVESSLMMMIEMLPS